MIDVAYDEPTDTLTICGIKYSGAIFRTMALAEPGTWIRINERRPDGLLDVLVVPMETERIFDLLTGRDVSTTKGN